jgi:anti-sigma factor RsiW
VNPTVYNDDARFFELLERWVEGNFNRRDEQEMLALTRSDDFRREAWEGFLSAPEADHATLLRRLRERLAQKQPRPRVFSLRFFMSAAAAMALLLVAVVFLPRLVTQKAVPLAQEKSIAHRNFVGCRSAACSSHPAPKWKCRSGQ